MEAVKTQVTHDLQDVPALQQGDRVSLVAPASGFSAEDFNKAIEYITSLGLVPVVNGFDEVVDDSLGFLAHDDEHRFVHLKAAIDDETTQAIWCFKGGYGSPRLLQRLAQLEVPAKNKLFIGFSDVTPLLNFFSSQWGWTCIHGAMLIQLATRSVSLESIEALNKVIFGQQTIINVPLHPLNTAAQQLQTAITNTTVVGGCAALMQSLLGTPQQLQCDGSIVLFEDDQFETPSRLDRIFNQFIRSGSLKNAKTVLLGNLLEGPMLDDKLAQELDITIKNFASDLDSINVPLFRNEQVGHGFETRPIAIGTQASISIGAEKMLNVETGINTQRN